jgi:hypothetical protein
MNNQFFQVLDNISNTLLTGAMWHTKAADEMRRLALRGFGRLNDFEACDDFKDWQCLLKLCRDRLEYFPRVEPTAVSAYHSFTIEGIADLKKFLHDYAERENAFIDLLNSAIRMSQTADISVYKFLINLTDDKQSETMRINMLVDRLDGAGWNPHDVMEVSRKLHEHYASNDDRDSTLS